jgi:mannobiose 2-epimerase
MCPGTVRQLKDQVENELKSNILNFWCRHASDDENGGFFGYISANLFPDAGHDKASVLNARILWTFSAAYRFYKEKKYLDMAARAFEYFRDNFINREHMGVYWMLDCTGRPKDTKNQVYANAFTIYALSEYYHAVGDKCALELAISLFGSLEQHARDKAYGGYLEALAHDWSPLSDVRLSAKDLNAPKSMNTHLHILEAYTNLFRAWKNDVLKESLKSLLETMMDRIVDNSAWSFRLFFDMNWTPCADITSYGHDIEGSWLIHEAAEVLGDPVLLGKAEKVAVNMAESVLRNGVDRKHGGIFNDMHGTKLDDNKDWWPQAEAVVGFLNAWQLTGRSVFLDEALKTWKFINKYIVDRKNGEWHWGVTRDGSQVTGSEKAGPWKCPYHNSRMCFEVISRAARLEGGC